MRAATAASGSLLGGRPGAVASAAFVAAVVASVVLPPAAECAPSAAAAAIACADDPVCAGELFVGPSEPEKRMSQLRRGGITVAVNVNCKMSQAKFNLNLKSIAIYLLKG